MLDRHKPKKQQSTPASDRARKISIDDWEKRVVEQAWQKRLAWLRRPRLRTAIFDEAWRDHQIADECVIRGAVFAERRRANMAKKINQITKKLGWSNERLALFEQLVVAYRREPAIKNYVRVRREFAEVEVHVAQFRGIQALESLFALEDKFRKVGIDPHLIAAALDAYEPSIDALCLHLLELLMARDKLPKDGPKHIERRRNAISDTMVNYLISEMLDSLDGHDETFRIPASLVVLIRHQLCTGTPDLRQEYLSRERRHNAALSFGQTLRPDERPSINKLATRVGIPRSTAARWLADKEFQEWIETGREWDAKEMIKSGREAFEKQIREGGW
jgi:hypothetical protein